MGSQSLYLVKTTNIQLLKMSQTVLTVVGGRMVVNKVPQSSNNSFPINGQQLMMQLDSMTSRMSNMVVTSDNDNTDMETEQTNTQPDNRQAEIFLRQQQDLERQQQYQQQLIQMQFEVRAAYLHPKSSKMY